MSFTAAPGCNFSVTPRALRGQRRRLRSSGRAFRITFERSRGATSRSDRVHINTRRVAFVRMTGRRDGVQPSGEGEERRDASPEAGPRATHYERSVTVPPDIG